jgi:hypothetical protein
MESKVLCFFNGTPLESSLEIYKALIKTPVKKEWVEDKEGQLNTMRVMEKTLCKHSVGGVILWSSLKKAAKELDLEEFEFHANWIITLNLLVTQKYIKADDFHGFMFIAGPKADILFKPDKEVMLCGLCLAPSKLKCGKCGQRYCCKEHQVSDWKKHKKECYGCLTTEEWRAHNSQELRERLTTPQRS